jgi:hypothetical protein
VNTPPAAEDLLLIYRIAELSSVPKAQHIAVEQAFIRLRPIVEAARDAIPPAPPAPPAAQAAPPVPKSTA